MMTTGSVVIVGAGLAGAKAAEALREQGFDGPRRAGRRRGRAPVRAAAAVEGVPARARPSARGASCTPRTGTPSTTSTCGWRRGRPRSTAADHAGRARRRRAARRTTRCCSRPGSSPRRSPIPGAELDGVHYLRTPVGHRPRSRADVRRRQAAGRHRRRLDRPGDGGRGPGRRAPRSRVLEAAELPLLRVLGPEMGQVFADLHRDARRRPAARRDVDRPADGSATGVRLGDGTEVAGRRRCSSASGVRPTHRLAEAGRARRRQRRRSSTRGCARATPTSTPSATSPTHDHPTARAPAPRRALGERAQPAGRRGRPRCSASDDGVRPAALLLQRPVRPRHGVRRLRRAATTTTGSWSAATWRAGSSSRSGSTTRAGCWPA